MSWVGSKYMGLICIRSNNSALAILFLCAIGIWLQGCTVSTPPSGSVRSLSAHHGLVDRLPDLETLSLSALRLRHYASAPRFVIDLSRSEGAGPYRERFMPAVEGRANAYDSVVLAYQSDGLRIYTRMDVPRSQAPATGYPVVIFVHGWVGRAAAPEYDFGYTAQSQYAELIDYYAKAGFVVLSPALRGHGTVEGVPADGIEYLDAWDNASYLSPMFYAIDILNLVAGIPELEGLVWPDSGSRPPIHLDLERIGISGHSQGADAVLTALGVSGEGSSLVPTLKAGSLWSGCFGPRLEQAALYGPMASTAEAFLAGDGHWNGTAVGRDGRVNADFVFGYPPDWIASVEPGSAGWTWQADTWWVPTVAEALATKFTEMYTVLNSQVESLGQASFSSHRDATGRTIIQHDPVVASALGRIGGFEQAQYLTEPIHFHFSDQDYYSPPAWNMDLANRMREQGTPAGTFVYPQNNHSLRASPFDWFSHGEVREGFRQMLRRDQLLFRSGGAELARHEAEDMLSVDALRHYAAELRNEFEVVRELPPLGDLKRREVAFTADGLRQFALLVEPAGKPPAAGWPVLLMSHGYHPDPPLYGRVANGSTDRPGDYYRSVPPLFAQQGFLVVIPDYRGHNDSEGQEFTRGHIAPYWYARDVIAAFRSIGSLPEADASQVFLWGHSMGGPVTLRALLALGSEVNAASIWSSSSAWLQSRDPDSAEKWQQDLQAELAGMPFDLQPALADAGPRLTELQVPLQIHHAANDATTSFSGSVVIHKALDAAARPNELFRYEVKDHLFTAPELQEAVNRDVQFFRRQMASE